MAFFRIPVEIDEEKSKQYLLYSGLPLMINSIRAYVSQISGQGPFGRYQFPTVDLASVINKDSERNEASESAEQAPK